VRMCLRMCMRKCMRMSVHNVRTPQFPLTWSTRYGAGGGGGGDEEARRPKALTPAPRDAQQLQHLASAFVGSPATSQTLSADLSNLERVVGQLRLARPPPSSRPLLKPLAVSPVMRLFLCLGRGKEGYAWAAHACGRLCSVVRLAVLSLSQRLRSSHSTLGQIPARVRAVFQSQRRRRNAQLGARSNTACKEWTRCENSRPCGGCGQRRGYSADHRVLVLPSLLPNRSVV
jgi:hypothetical protein